MMKFITVVVNKWIASSTVPSQWKQTNMAPVPKCKHCTSLSHFRPISVLPKILERVLYNQIVSILTNKIYLHLISQDSLLAIPRRRCYCM